MNLKRSLSQFINTHKLQPVSINIDQSDEKIFFLSDGGKKDITEAHALVTLNPFSIAVNLAGINFFETDETLLRVYDREEQVGTLILKLDKIVTLANMRLGIYEAILSSDSFSVIEKFWTSLLLQIKNKTDKKSKRFVVPPRELLKLFVYTMKPRPVYLVSVKHEKGVDVFPIDILGKVSEEFVLFAVRSSSPAIPFILDTKKVCASAVPFAKVKDVYRFGGHHPNGILPPQLNDISFISSRQLNIPIPEFAVAVQELAVEEIFTKGIHTQFLSRMINQYQLTDELQLAHTPWFNKKYFQGKFNAKM